MNYYFITGSSKGLGKALVELLIQDENNFIYGYSRSGEYIHDRFSHIEIDLSDSHQLIDFSFPVLNNAEKIVLINNAGMVGDINHVGNIDNQKIIDSYNLNLITPTILINNFINSYGKNNSEKIILNISSGAGRTPIDGWSVYCSTKAGVDMFSQVLNEEITLDKLNLKVLSLAPGIIDTDMQDEIREAEKIGFSNVERFINYKKDGELTDPSITAGQVVRFIKEKELKEKVICSVRDL